MRISDGSSGLCSSDLEAVLFRSVLGCLDHRRMVGQAQVVVGAEVQHRAPVFQGDLGGLRRGDDALGLEQAGVADFIQRCGVVLRQFHESTTLPALPASIRSKPCWNSPIGNWWVSTLPRGKPPSTSWVILYQVS